MRTPFALLLLAALLPAAAAQAWVEIEPMPTAREGASSAVVEGRLYVMGGRDAAGTPLRVVEAFDPATGWQTVAPLLAARADADAAVLDGRIVVVGGRDSKAPLAGAEAYDPEADAWAPFPGLPTERQGLEVATVEGTLYAVGGADAGGALLPSAEAYRDTTWDAYEPLALTPGRARFGAVAAGGGLLVFGGFSASGPLQSTQLYVPGQPTLALFSMGSPRGSFASAIGGGGVFAIGGRNANDRVVADVEELTGIYETWRARTPLPLGREAAVAEVLGDTLYVAGGADVFGTVLATVVKLPLQRPTAAEAAPRRAALAVAGPNPSRHGTAFEVRAHGAVRLTVYDVLGREVAVLLDGPVAGEARVAWDAAVPSGLYVARLEGAGGASAVSVTVAR